MRLGSLSYRVGFGAACVVGVLGVAVAQDRPTSGDSAVPIFAQAAPAARNVPPAVLSAAAGQVDRVGNLETRPADMDVVRWHIADCQTVIPYVEAELEKATRPAARKFAESLLERLRSIERPRKVRLSLQDALHRAMTYSLAVRVQSYNPAISTASVVEAEAAFDAIYFMNMTKNKQDRPSASQLAGTTIDTFVLSGGVRKLLPTGMQVSTELNIRRQFIDLQFQLINPEYTSAFIAQFTQPLLRNGGLDFNRSTISISANDLKVSEQAFKRQVRDTLSSVEQAYWRLTQARREVVINARLLAELERTYDFIWQRRDFDTYQIQLSQTEADVASTKADFVRVVNQVFDAEDALIAAMNDPGLDLAEDVEIIPTEFPAAESLTIDRLAEVQTALDNRSELVEAALQIDNAKLRVGVAKNQALPRLDLTFRYTVDGLGTNADDAFDQVTQSDFMEYLVVLDFEWPIGNRARKAALRSARLRHAQQIALLKSQIEQVILEVNTAVRAIRSSFDRVEPSLQSAEANEDQVASVVARAEKKDFATLNQELGARRGLANSRSALLDALVQYKIAVIELERAKGTLLEYDSVRLVGPDDLAAERVAAP